MGKALIFIFGNNDLIPLIPFMKKLPLALIYLRLAIGLLIIPLVIYRTPYYPTIAVTLLIFGVLSDIFDGIIARKYQVSTPQLRRMDSTIDQIFFICFSVATYIQCPDF